MSFSHALCPSLADPAPRLQHVKNQELAATGISRVIVALFLSWTSVRRVGSPWRRATCQARFGRCPTVRSA